MRRLGLMLLACLPLLTACGEERSPAPDVFAVKKPKGTKRVVFLGAGITVDRPANWKLRRRDAPGVFEILSGEALVAGWAYPREEPLPASEEQLESAKDRLVEAIKQRDPDFRLEQATTAEFAGSPAIDVRGQQLVSKRRIRTRSVHIFEGEVEYVIEVLAPPSKYRLVDGGVLEPLLRSLEITGEVSEDRK